MFVQPDQGPLLSDVERLTNVEIVEVFHETFEPGPEPRVVRQRRAALEQERETNRKNLGRTVKEAPSEDVAGDETKFPGGVVPRALPKRRMGGRVRGRRR
jgi:hypothetical protein